MDELLDKLYNNLLHQEQTTLSDLEAKQILNHIESQSRTIRRLQADIDGIEDYLEGLYE